MAVHGIGLENVDKYVMRLKFVYWPRHIKSEGKQPSIALDVAIDGSILLQFQHNCDMGALKACLHLPL